jgi:hypothetical protein
MMKDMSLEELEEGVNAVIKSDDLGFLSKLAITNAWNELLRRFEALEKELKATKLAHAVEKQIMQDNFDKCKTAAEYWKKKCEALEKEREK